MTTIYIALGSNKGDSEAIIKEALCSLKQIGSSFKASSLYQTLPVDCTGGMFINAVCSLETDLLLEEFIPLLEAIELQLGKTPKAKNEARFIDLDILFYGSEEYHHLGYTIPHPAWQQRYFVLKPLSEIIEVIEMKGKSLNIRDLCKKLL